MEAGASAPAGRRTGTRRRRSERAPSTSGPLPRSTRSWERTRRSSAGGSASRTQATRSPIHRASSSDLNLLYIAQSIEDVAARTGRDVEAVQRALRRARTVMFDARETRPRPHLDDKVIAAWNGLMMAAMARAARQLVDSPRRDEWRRAAIRAAEFVHAHLWRPAERRLLRRHRDGEAAIDAFCEDYACLAWGALELFQTTGEARWLDWAAELTAVETERFYDDADGGWYSTTGDDPSILLRLKEDYDGAEPSAASVTVRNLIQLAQITGEAGYLARAQRTFERYGPGLGQVARVMPLMAATVALWHGRRTEIVVVGTRGTPDLDALERVVAAGYLAVGRDDRHRPGHGSLVTGAMAGGDDDAGRTCGGLCVPRFHMRGADDGSRGAAPSHRGRGGAAAHHHLGKSEVRSQKREVAGRSLRASRMEGRGA